MKSSPRPICTAARHAAHAHAEETFDRGPLRRSERPARPGKPRSRPRRARSFGETIGNPGGSILDLEALAALADSRTDPAHRRQHLRHALPLPADRLGRDDRHPFRDEIHRRPRQQHRRRRRRFGQFRFRRFPTIADPSPSYHGLRFFDTFGHYGFLMKLRAETVRDTAPAFRR